MQNVIYYGKNHPMYPEKLKSLDAVPAGLHVLGRLPDPRKKTAAIVGARSCTSYGRRQARYFARRLSECGVQVVSGLASGVDAAAHEGALEGGEKTFAVLGSGVDVCYPRENFGIYRRIAEDGGGILSEFEMGSRPLGWHFPRRNRIISGLSDLVLVVEARAKSGALITADCALEQGKAVYAIPGKLDDPLSEGCNHLLFQGAGIALCPEVLLEELGADRKTEIKKSDENLRKLPKLFQKVYRHLDQKGKSLEMLSRETGIDVQETARILMILELEGLAEEYGSGILPDLKAGGPLSCRRRKDLQEKIFCCIVGLIYHRQTPVLESGADAQKTGGMTS